SRSIRDWSSDVCSSDLFGAMLIQNLLRTPRNFFDRIHFWNRKRGKGWLFLLFDSVETVYSCMPNICEHLRTSVFTFRENKQFRRDRKSVVQGANVADDR